MFEGLMRVESAVHTSINEKRIDNDVIANVERELKNIKDRAKFQNSSSFSKRKADLEQLIHQQKNLLAMAPEQRVQEEVAKMERYLTVLENALKKDVINPEIIKYIRISIDEMAAPQKLNFPAPQQNIITKRIDNLKHLLGMFDSLLHMQQVVIEQKDLSPVMSEGIAEELRNTQKELEQLGLPKDLADSVTKHLARVNNQLVPKLFEFLDQLARSAEVISTLDQLKEVENQFKLLQKLRKNLDLTKDQEGDIDKKFAEVESLLNQQRDPLLEQQKRNEELERIAQEQKRAQQIELQKQKEQQELQERERQEVQER
jgi:hypothetical protein